MAAQGRRRRALALLALLALFLAGCWDRREVEERSNVLATSFDLCTGDDECGVVAVRQVAIPGRIRVGSLSAGGPPETVALVQVRAKNVPESQRKSQAMLSRRLDFGHTRVLVFGNDFAETRNLAEYMDYLRRIPEARRTMWLVVAEGRAEEVVRAMPPLERVPALFLNDMLDDAVRRGVLPTLYLSTFLTATSSKGEDPVLPLLRMVSPNHPQLAGLAVFRSFRMVGRLSSDELNTYMQLRGYRKGSEVIRVGLPEGRFANLAVSGRQVRYQLRQVKGRIHARIIMQLETNLRQASPELSSSEPQVMTMIEREASALVEAKAAKLVERLQHELGTDVLALGERVRAHMPSLWAQVGNDWQAAFAAAQFSFDVHVQIRRSGMAVD